MSIKERDILKLLDGNASSKKLKALEEWTLKKPRNVKKLEQYQIIYDEAKELSSYNKVDASTEWAAFQQALATPVKQTLVEPITDNDLLMYLDGTSSPSEKINVEAWKSANTDNQQEFEIFDLVLTETAKLNDYKETNIDDEWSSFLALTKENKGDTTTHLTSEANNSTFVPTPTINEKLKPVTRASTYVAPTVTPTPAKEVAFTPQPVQEEEKSNSTFLWYALAAAAAFFLVGSVGWNVWQSSQNNAIGEDLYLTYATADLPESLTISDGSIMALSSDTKLTYFKNVDEVDVRSVELEGKGTFEIAKNPDKPFILKAKRSGVGIRVLGTKFRFEDSNDYIEVIENIEGSVRAYSLADTTTYVIMTAGDRYGFDGVNFINLNEGEYLLAGESMKIQFVLDHLMKESEWRVITKAYSDFDPEGYVTIDLSKSYEDILLDLELQADFEYIPLDCDGCYQINRFMSNSVQ